MPCSADWHGGRFVVALRWFRNCDLDYDCAGFNRFRATNVVCCVNLPWDSEGAGRREEGAKMDPRDVLAWFCGSLHSSSQDRAPGLG